MRRSDEHVYKQVILTVDDLPVLTKMFGIFPTLHFNLDAHPIFRLNHEFPPLGMVTISYSVDDDEIMLFRWNDILCYWDYLDQSAQDHYDYFMRHGDPTTAESMFTQSLSDALRGNEGE